MANSHKSCKHCKKSVRVETMTTRQFGNFCSVAHSMAWIDANSKRLADKARAQRIAKEKKKIKSRKEAIKSPTEWHNELQVLVNRYVRLRDRKDGCISCDKPSAWNGQWHASHYFSRGSSSSLRFNLWNNHKACSICNNHLSGNIEAYTPRLIDKIGQERYDWLVENKSKVIKFDLDWTKRAIKIARKGIKRLEKR